MKSSVFKKAQIIFLAILLCIGFCSCDGVSSYRATGLVKASRKNYCSVSFSSLDGRIVQKPRFTLASEGQITCTAKLTEGEMDIYYESCGVKTHFMNIKAGEEKTLTGGYIERGRVKVYVETEGAKGGKVEITLGGA